MELCLELFKSAHPLTMQNIARLDIGIIPQLWIPVEFVGDYITQRLCLKLIVAVLKHLNIKERKQKVADLKLNAKLQNLILKLSTDLMNFENLSRQILNSYNMKFSKHCTVFSIYCIKALFGKFELFKPKNVTNFWIDFNYTSKSVSLFCRLNQSEANTDEFYIKIKIDKLQIENQLDCFVYFTENATFSTKVSTILLDCRVAVFTLPKNQLELLKKNIDLIDYYNSFQHSNSSDASISNTVAKYSTEFNDYPQLTPCSKQYSGNQSIKSAKVLIHKCDGIQNKNNKLNNSSTISIVSHYEERSSETNSNDAAIKSNRIFKKPETYKFDKNEQIKKRQKTFKEFPNQFEVENKNTIKTSGEINIPSNAKRKASLTSIIKSSSVKRNTRNSSYLTKSLNSIQMATDSSQHKCNVSQETINKVQHSILKKYNTVEMSPQKRGNSYIHEKNNLSERACKSSDSQNSFAFPNPGIQEHSMLGPNQEQIKKTKRFINVQMPGISVQKISDLRPSANPVSSKSSTNYEQISINQPQYLKPNSSQHSINENRVTTSLKCYDLKEKTPVSTGATSELSKDTSRRFFKYRSFPNSSTTNKSNRKVRSKKTKIENRTKTKSVNLVKPLNYVGNLSLSMKESISDSKGKKIFKQIKNFAKEKNENGQNLNLNVTNPILQNSVHSFAERANKQKILLKDVQTSNIVPYSVWKADQKVKKNNKTILLSTMEHHKSINLENNNYRTQPSIDLFDKLKYFEFKKNLSLCNQPDVVAKNSPSSFESEKEIKKLENLFASKCNTQDALYIQIVRHNQSNAIMESPIPTERDDPTINSTLLERNLTPKQISYVLESFYPQSSNDRDIFEERPNSVSPVYEELSDESLQTQPFQSTNLNISLEESYYLKEINRRHQTSPQFMNSVHSARFTTLQNGDLQIVKKSFQKLPEQQQTSLRDSPISVYSDCEQDNARQINASMSRKRTHSPENSEKFRIKVHHASFSPLKGCDKLIPEFIMKLTNEKECLLKNIQIKLNDDIFHKFDNTVRTITKLIDIHQNAIKKEQQKLISTLENINLHQQILHKNQCELEKIHSQIIEHKKTFHLKAEEIDKIYNEAAEILESYANGLKRDNWLTFSKDIINSLNKRLSGYLNI